MCKALGHFSVVGQKKYACGVLVEASHRINSHRAALDEVKDSLVCVRIACRSHETLRLVHDEVHLVLALESLSVEADVVLVDVYLGAKLSDNYSVDCYNSGLYEGIGLTA